MQGWSQDDGHLLYPLHTQSPRTDAFETYAKAWPPIIARCGGELIGYFLPKEGANNLALALIDFETLAAYETYRAKLAEDDAAKANVAHAQSTRCILVGSAHFCSAADVWQSVLSSAIIDRPPLEWPGGRHLAVYVGLNLEHYAFGEHSVGLLDAVAQRNPDPINFSWRDYGVRVGVWRMAELFERLELKPSVLLNADVCDEYSRIIVAKSLAITTP